VKSYAHVENGQWELLFHPFRILITLGPGKEGFSDVLIIYVGNAKKLPGIFLG